MINTLFKKFSIRSQSQHFKASENVFLIGKACHSIYRVETGQVHLHRDDKDGNRILLFRAYAGDFFAEASINAEHYHCTAQCILDSQLSVFSSQQLRQHLSSNLEFSNAWINHLASELRRQRASVERLSLKTASEKIKHYILTEGNAKGELEIKGTLSDIAQVIGLSRESLYRTLSKMKSNQQIKHSGNALRLI